MGMKEGRKEEDTFAVDEPRFKLYRVDYDGPRLEISLEDLRERERKRERTRENERERERERGGGRESSSSNLHLSSLLPPLGCGHVKFLKKTFAFCVRVRTRACLFVCL